MKFPFTQPLHVHAQADYLSRVAWDAERMALLDVGIYFFSRVYVPPTSPTGKLLAWLVPCIFSAPVRMLCSEAVRSWFAFVLST